MKEDFENENRSQSEMIGIKRDSGMSFEVGTPEGVIEAMVEIDDSLYIIKSKAIYALQTADQID